MTELGQVLSLVSEAEDRIKKAKEILQREMGTAPADKPWRGGLFLADILREGGSVSKERLYELASKYGFDNRGLGGFYTGNGSLQMIDEMDRIMLTPEGVKTARKYLKREAGGAKAYQAGEANLTKIAEAPFAEDWNSDGDAAYDNL